MIIQYTSARNPVWANEEHTLIDLIVNFAHLDEEEVHFTASPGDRYEHGRELFERASNGDFGPVGEYIPPPVIEPEPVLDPVDKLKAFLDENPDVANLLK